MAEVVKVPTLGLTISKVEIVEWLVKEGVNVKEGDVLFVAETEKATFEVTSPTNGIVLKIFNAVGDSVKVNEAVVAIVGEENEDISELLSSVNKDMLKNEPTEELISSPKPNKTITKKVVAMPTTRSLAKKYGIDLQQVEGSGKNGLITEEDVEEYYKNTFKKDGAYSSDDKDVRTIPFIGIRKTIADNLVNSLQTAAHVTILDEIDMTQVLTLRKEIRNQLDTNISIVSFVIKAADKALKKFPIINSVIDGENIRIKNYVNMGIAVASGQNLVVPVLHNVDKKDFFDIASEFEKLINIAREGRLSPQMMQEGTLTISNPGPFGTLIATPIINQPQSAIIWMGRIDKRPVVVEDTIIIRSMMYMCISYDHRVMDGFIAAQYLQEVKRYLQNPGLILIR